MMTELTDEQIMQAFSVMQTAFYMLQVQPLDELADALSRARAIGPFIDPTRARNEMRTWQENARLVDAARKFVAAFEEGGQ